MTLKTLLLTAMGAASLTLPAVASAQPYYGGYQQPYYGGYYQQHDYGRGDYYGDRDDRRFAGYPEFRGAEDHIRSEIFQAMRDGSIERYAGYRMLQRLNDIRAQEAREFREHGWNLPYDDRMRIRAQLDRLDRWIDRADDRD
jgi:hypothetical protein